MSSFYLVPAAWRDLDSIWLYIARDSIRNADFVVDAVFSTCRSAASMNGLGHRRSGIRNSKTLFLAVSGYERYSIAYLADSQPLRILRVVHGARDVPRMFRG